MHCLRGGLVITPQHHSVTLVSFDTSHQMPVRWLHTLRNLLSSWSQWFGTWWFCINY